MSELILDEFYNKILLEIKENDVNIDGWKFNIEFQTKVNNETKYLNKNIFETLEIKNKELFDKLLILYTKKMYEIIKNSNLKRIDYVYYDGNKKFIIDFILSSLWNNVTDTDLQNPIEYLENRINFLNDPLYNNEMNNIFINNVDFLNNSSIEYIIKMNNPVLETPYSFCPYIVRNKDNNEVFELPKIHYGISNGKCYIYSVQNNKDREDNSYIKKINRILYKVNKNIIDDYEVDNIKDVSPSALVSISIFIKLLIEKNISEIYVIDYMPIRYKAKSTAINKKIEKISKNMTLDCKNKLIEENNFKQEQIQRNMTDKLIRNFRRLEFQLGNIRIISYPKDADSFMHIKTTNESIHNDNLLNMLYNYNIEEKNKKIRNV